MTIEIITAILSGVFAIVTTILGVWLSKRWTPVQVESSTGEQLKFKQREVREVVRATKSIKYENPQYSFSLFDVLRHGSGVLDGYDSTGGGQKGYWYVRKPFLVSLEQFFEEKYVADMLSGEPTKNGLLIADALFMKIAGDCVSLNILDHDISTDGIKLNRYHLTNFGHAVIKYILTRD